MADRTYMAVSLWRTYMDGLETNIIANDGHSIHTDKVNTLQFN